MHPVTHRYEQFDQYDPLVAGLWMMYFLARIVLLSTFGIRHMETIDRWATRAFWVLILVTGYYLYWRFCLCWKGIYYP